MKGLGCLIAAILFLVACAGLLGTSCTPAVVKATPTATQTPGPSATPKPEAPPEVTAYIAWMLLRGTKVSEAMGLYVELFRQVADNPALLDSATWKAKVAALMAVYKSEGLALQRYSPVPAVLKPLNDLQVLDGKDLVYVADQTTRFLDTQDPDYLLNAAQGGARIAARAPERPVLSGEVRQRYR